MADWNAGRYHEVSSPQQAWGRRVLARLSLEGSESVLDIGCGTGRVTAEIAARVPRGRVVGVDRSPNMLGAARVWLHAHAPGARVVLADGACLPFRRAFDAAFSSATFHWIRDHGALFRSVVQALKPGGRLVAQCGGQGNLAVLRARAARLMRDTRFAPYFEDWIEPAYYADAESTRHQLDAAGFADIHVWLEAAPTKFEGPEAYREFITTVCIRDQMARLAPAERAVFANRLTAEAVEDTPPLTLDYWRLNIAGRRPA